MTPMELKALDDYDYAAVMARDLKVLYRLASLLRASEKPMTLDEKLDWGNRLHLIVSAAEELPAVDPALSTNRDSERPTPSTNQPG